tara:strand:+ start:66 stop:515 length:450 start_codon:yes stop_codon:yes gene_type:complete
MKIIKKTNGKTVLKISKSEWSKIGGWTKKAATVGDAMETGEFTPTGDLYHGKETIPDPEGLGIESPMPDVVEAKLAIYPDGKGAIFLNDSWHSVEIPKTILQALPPLPRGPFAGRPGSTVTPSPASPPEAGLSPGLRSTQWERDFFGIQ